MIEEKAEHHATLKAKMELWYLVTVFYCCLKYRGLADRFPVVHNFRNVLQHIHYKPSRGRGHVNQTCFSNLSDNHMSLK